MVRKPKTVVNNAVDEMEGDEGPPRVGMGAEDQQTGRQEGLPRVGAGTGVEQAPGGDGGPFKPMNIFDLPRTEEDAIKFLQERGILPQKRICKSGHEMKLSIAREVLWQCQKAGCKGKAKVNMRVGNFLEGSKLSYVTIVRFIYCWAHEYSSVKFDKHELGMSDETTVDWSSYLREICVVHLVNKPEAKIGGEGKVVEIDESLFSKRKNHVGRVLPQQWIFGGICRETKESFLVEVPDRTAKTLLSEISKHIASGSIIMSDCWAAYKTAELEKAGFEHFKVNHTYNFLNPDDKNVHTQHVERMWSSAKWRNKRQRGTKRDFMESYLAEFMVRQEMKAGNEDPFDSILEKIAEGWPPAENI